MNMMIKIVSLRNALLNQANWTPGTALNMMIRTGRSKILPAATKGSLSAGLKRNIRTGEM